MKLSLLTIIVFSFGLSACAIVSRHQTSGYSDARSYGVAEEDSSAYDTEAIRELSPEEREKLEDRILLSRLEKSTHTTEERSQYKRYKNTLESDRERIEFLSLDGYKARERYLQNKGYASSPNRYTREVASLIEENDIAVGMGKQAVLESWGDPVSVEVAGRPESGNERWRYSEYVTTPEGYQQEQRYLYFENGRLVGWEKY